MKRLLLVVLVLVMSPAVVGAADLVPITKLGIAPWLGEVKNEKDLLEKFRREKPNFVKYIRHDLKKAVGLEISSVEAIEIVASMEKMMKDGKIEKISIPDGTVFKSMGWKSRKTGKIMRTANPILRLGKPIEGFLVKVNFGNYKIEYVFLAPCGNICMKELKAELPPKAEYVPEAPLLAPEVPLLPKVEAPPPQKCPECPEQKTYVYVYVTVPPPPATIPVGYIPPPSPFVYREPVYYSQPSISFWSSGVSRPYYYHHRPAPVRPPRVRIVPPAAIRPPIAHTRPPTVRPPGVQTK